MPIITIELINSLKTAGGWTRADLDWLGVGWPPPPGWQVNVLGHWIPNRPAQLSLANGWPRNAKKRRRKYG